ncbi:pilus assembly protein TadG-related protein [Nesterenkonia pannonica]|uniref:pilus assembly protein TadG-related protein n=1 Tax=Nesterenkonia pannonica TaxID=1548602 RepID=UPI002164BE8F|nr:Tad domain-containing protein [Nesterenkonia pannonica]
MQRLKNNDRGAVGVIVALMLVPIMILAALAIDVAAMHATKQQLQTGADAGALAIAQDCARYEDDANCDAGTAAGTAQQMATANVTIGSADGDRPRRSRHVRRNSRGRDCECLRSLVRTHRRH